MANEHSIRVSARGEFGQLQRGLKQLQGDLKSALGEIDRGARKGGIFDESSLRALSLYRDRFKSTLEELNKEFEKQNRIVDRLHDKMKDASRKEQEDLQKQIDLREKEMDVIRRQLFEVEKLYEKRNKEADGYDTTSGGGMGNSNRTAGGDHHASRLFSNMLMGGRGLLGMAGLAGIGTMAHQAYQGPTCPVRIRSTLPSVCAAKRAGMVSPTTCGTAPTTSAPGTTWATRRWTHGTSWISTAGKRVC